MPSGSRRQSRLRWLIICSTVKRFLGISALFTMDPEAKYLTQFMDPVKGRGAGQSSELVSLEDIRSPN
jgi:hypothetical protein